MTRPFDLAPDAQRALREAENFCWRANVAIVSAEHLLCGCLVQLSIDGRGGYDQETLATALEALHPPGMTELSNTVMFGSAARDALTSSVREARATGLDTLSAAGLAAGVIRSDEVNPMFYGALGVDRQTLLGTLSG